jgi:hypothetical protein
VKFPAPTRKDHERFCITEGWTERKRATGRAGTHHVNYEFALPDGNMLWTRISHPVDRTRYGKQMWSHILGDQLHVSEPEFWSCVTNGTLPDRGGAAPPAREALPADQVYQLTQTGVPEADLRAMSKAEAISRMTAHWSQG